MAYSYIEYTSNSSANSGKDYTYSFSAVAHDTTNIKVTLGGSALSSSNYSVVQGTVTLSAAPGAGSSPLNVALSSTNVLRIYRQTNRTAAEVVFSANSVIQDEDLNTATDQARFLALEAIDRTNESIAIDPNDTTQYNIEVDGVDKRISGVATPTGDDDAVNKAYSDANVTITNDYKLTTISYATRTDGNAQTYSSGSGSDTSDESAKNWAVGVDSTHAPADGSAKEWAIGGQGVEANEVTSGNYSARKYASNAATSASSASDSATNAAASEVAAKNSAASVSSVYENFSDTYLGKMADGDSASSGSANGTWAKNSSSITLASTSGTIEVGQEVTGSGIPTDANVLSVDGSTIVISENMNAAGSSVSLTFTGQGIYGAFNTSKDGPGTDNDGDALVTGQLYFNTTDNEMRIYDGGNWIAASAAGSASLLEYKFVTTSGQVSSKTYSGTADVGGTLSYTTSNIIVFLNGVQLKDTTDYTASNGTSIVLVAAPALNDELNVIAFKSFTAADTVSASSGGTFSGNVTHSGTLNANGTINANSTIDMQGTELILDADADTSFHASSDDQIDIKVGGTDVGNFNSNTLKLVKDGNPILEIEDTAETAYGGSWLSAPTVDFKHTTANADEHGVLGTLKFKGTTKSNLGVLTNNTDIARLDGVSIEGSSGIGQRITDVKGGFRFKGLDGAGNFVDLMNIEGKTLKIESGGGIDFHNYGIEDSSSATTVSSNLLDDYEEGTWAPKLTIGNGNSIQKSGGDMTYAHQTGKYTKIGNIVLADFYIQVNAASTTSDAYYVGGLPFNNRDLGSLYTFGMQLIVHANIASAQSGVYFYEGLSNTDRGHIRFQKVDGSSTTIQSTRNADGVIGASTWLSGKIQYYVG